jgi:hypothetical protein
MIATAFALVVLVPGVAEAWGPATHLELGQAVLNGVRLAPHLKAVIEAFPYDFLYGGVIADVVVGKNLVEELKHCHNWKAGFKLLDRARGPSQEAFAYGYLSHLAADTVAHNHFIPEMMIRSFSARTLRHIYWEMRFDAMADKGVWRYPETLARRAHRDNDMLLESVIEDSPLSFRANRTIFSSIMIIHRVRQWHRMLNLLSRASRWRLAGHERAAYMDASLEAITGVLTHAHRASCLKKDPTGRHSLNAAKLVRKRLKAARSGGRDWQEAMDGALRLVSIHGCAPHGCAPERRG